MTKVLVVEDDPHLLRALSMNLVARGYEVVTARTGTRALAEVAAGEPDLILLDLGLPDLAGFDVIRGVRAFDQTPIMVLSGRTDTGDKVTALDLGADDYVTKPFDVDELMARLRATSRRVVAEGVVPPVSVGETRVDFEARTATRDDGEAVHLTPTEWQLLEELARRPGRLITRDELLTRLRGGSERTDPSYLRIYVGQLRRKLEPDPARPRHLLTEPGLGYRFQV